MVLISFNHLYKISNFPKLQGYSSKNEPATLISNLNLNCLSFVLGGKEVKNFPFLIFCNVIQKSYFKSVLTFLSISYNYKVNYRFPNKCIESGHTSSVQNKHAPCFIFYKIIRFHTSPNIWILGFFYRHHDCFGIIIPLYHHILLRCI